MRIGDLAALVGVSTRTVRYYHHLGLLPEPERLPNGYREYGLRDAVALAHVRHLAGLGLTLDELRDALADDGGKDFREVLQELDADLAKEQEAIAARRAGLAALLEQPDLRPDSMISPDATAMLRDLAAGGSKFAELDHELLTLVNMLAGPEGQADMVELMRPLNEPEALARGHAIYERLDELAGAGPGDERIAGLAEELAEHIPEEMARLVPPEAVSDPSWLRVILEDLSPAQAEVLRLVMVKLRERV
jgi:DNA-binding transcriptional MerR regulator